MKLIVECNLATNGGSCNTKKNQDTGLYVPCLFSEQNGWKEECKGKSEKETIKFLQDSILELAFKMGKCRKRIGKKWRNHNTKQKEIEKVRKQVQEKINGINHEIKLLLKESRQSKIKL